MVEHGLLNKPECTWNTDESGIPLRYATGQVLAPRGARSVYSINNNNRQQITTLVAVNAAGQWIPPMHVYPGERFRTNPLQGGVPGAYMGRSATGWMTAELFYGWLTCHFATSIPPARPVVLLVDGHSSHNYQLAVSQILSGERHPPPPHCTHAIQPCDVGLFKPIKQNWTKFVRKFVCQSNESVNKYNFAQLFRLAWDESLKPATLVNSFRACGICPFNRDAIPAGKVLPSTTYAHSNTADIEDSDKDPFEDDDVRTLACVVMGGGGGRHVT